LPSGRKEALALGKGSKWKPGQGEMIPNESSPEETVVSWSAEERAEAAMNVREYIAILREWDSKERMKRARCIVDSASPEE